MTRLAVVLSSVRPNRAGGAVAQWVVDQASAVEGVEVDLVDLAELNLPVFAEAAPPAMAAPTDPAGAAFNERIKAADAIIFVTPEYNWSIPGALKNAIDFLEPVALAHKGVGIVSYSSTGGVRPAEALRVILANFQASVARRQIGLNMKTDFENFSTFVPTPARDTEVPALVADVVASSQALASLR
ncbi:NADPH-dependent oxidoreductase [Actinomyces viscosus]|uniref:FMN-dependent NADPH-azoreductase n=1 Tax=Actinomyces viscosus TaxID=1656 RepID=A0A448PP64_ACTVI|nr:NAD(P)H-dependent oxidoreductase [Actinomyces viscosus]TFH52787.1 NADPH-dependent oxidoreductase [Actinomyces viscosus]VEI18379.1 FMN-dependent NADPH-azoreductase [Actinomyces viscosus]